MSNDHAFGPRITSGSGRTSRQAGLLMLALSRFVWTHGHDDDPDDATEMFGSVGLRWCHLQT